MPAIPVYTASPITAATKPSGITPQTATPNNNPDADTLTPPSRYTPADQPQPTPTRTAPPGGPPPPQPGAVPRLPVATSTAAAPPPPPQGASYQPPAPTAAPQYSGISQPPQLGMPAPAMTYGQRGTVTAMGYPPSGAGTHPPGYQQNTSGLDNYQSAQAQNDSYGRDRDGAEEEGVWGSAVKWAQAAVKKLSDAETEVWRRINKE